jgi:hypothetical protein
MGKNLVLAATLITCLVLTGTAQSNTVDVVAGAAMNGTNFGLEITPDGTSTKAYVQSDHPSGETTYNFEFYIDFNDLVTKHGKQFTIVEVFRNSPVKKHLFVFAVWRSDLGKWKISVKHRENTAVANDKKQYIGRITANAGAPMVLRVELVTGAGDGSVTIYKNDNQKGQKTGLTNDDRIVDKIRVGLPLGSENKCPVGGCTGSFYIDEFVSTR